MIWIIAIPTVGRVAQWLRVLAVLAENLTLVASSHDKWLTTLITSVLGDP